jgi:hypothetical protein
MTATAERRRLVRADTDWARLYREGMRMRLGPDDLSEASAFIAPFEADRDLVVLLIPCRRVVTGRLREVLLQAASLAQNLGLWAWLQQLGRHP